MLNRQQLFIWGQAGIDLGGLRQLGKWYRLEIKVKGDNRSFYVYDDWMFERKDKFNTSGGILLWSFDAVVEFDNVVILFGLAGHTKKEIGALTLQGKSTKCGYGTSSARKKRFERRCTLPSQVKSRA